MFTFVIWDMRGARRASLLLARDRHRLAADVPVGVLLSGGLDSSLLVGLLAEHVDDLQTFSIGFEGIPGVSVGAETADEFEFSDLIAAQFKIRHHKHLSPNTWTTYRWPGGWRCVCPSSTINWSSWLRGCRPN